MHAKVAPSSLARIIACPGSLALAEPYLDQAETDEEKEGTAGHWLALEYSEGRFPDVGSVAPNGVTIDADMVEGAKLWCATIKPGGVSEVPVTIERIHPQCWGTPDRWEHTPSDSNRGGVLTIRDYKYGFKYVDPFENWQLIAYALGVIDLLGAQGFSEMEMRVDFCIVQPRSYHKNGPVQYWRHSTGRLLFAHELRTYANVAHMQVEEALKPFAPTRTGPHCLYCPARHACETLRKGVSDVVEFAGRAERLELHSQAVGVELAILQDAAKLLEARKTGLEQQAEHLLRIGTSVPNYGLEPGQSRLKWESPVGELLPVFDALGYDIRKPQEVITPTQARDRLKIDEAVMSVYSSRPPAGMKLKRVSSNEARKVFGT